jgi:tubulin-specific chaperone D
VVAPACAALLQQGVERIARVRETAIRQLRGLLAEPRVAAAMPAAAAVSAALPTDDDQLTGVVSLEAVRRLAGLLTASPQHYTKALLEGLVASVGGVDAALTRAASSSLVDVILAATAGSSGTQAAHPTEALVAATLVEIWQKHAKSSRMAAPLLRTADLLVTQVPGVMSARVPAPPPAASSSGAAAPDAPAAAASSDAAFPDVAVELCRAETRLCSDVGRLMDASNLLCHLLPAPNPCRTSAYQGLLVLLGSKYPKVCGGGAP